MSRWLCIVLKSLPFFALFVFFVVIGRPVLTKKVREPRKPWPESLAT